VSHFLVPWQVASAAVRRLAHFLSQGDGLNLIRLSSLRRFLFCCHSTIVAPTVSMLVARRCILAPQEIRPTLEP
jgi:hypothetical protein